MVPVWTGIWLGALPAPRWLAPTRMYAPRRLILPIPAQMDDLPGLLAERVPQPGGVAYVCDGPTCRPPVESPESLRTILHLDAAPTD